MQCVVNPNFGRMPRWLSVVRKQLTNAWAVFGSHSFIICSRSIHGLLCSALWTTLNCGVSLYYYGCLRVRNLAVILHLWGLGLAPSNYDDYVEVLSHLEVLIVLSRRVLNGELATFTMPLADSQLWLDWCRNHVQPRVSSVHQFNSPRRRRLLPGLVLSSPEYLLKPIKAQ